MEDSGVFEGVKDSGVWEHRTVELCSVKCEPELWEQAPLPPQVKVSQVGGAKEGCL